MLATPVLATSADVDFGQSYAEDTSLGNSDPRDIMTNLLNLAMTFLAIIAVIVILIGGFKWMTAAGSEDKVSEAKKIVVGGVIGLVIILAAWAIASFVLNTVAEQI
ncbi:pilin [bacterium]|nr:pilin [bacterium]